MIFGDLFTSKKTLAIREQTEAIRENTAALTGNTSAQNANNQVQNSGNISGLISNIQRLTAEQKALAVANGTQLTSWTNLKIGIGSATKAIGGFLAANPVGTILLIVSAVYGLVKAYDALTISVEETRERAENLIASYEKALDEANSNAETVENLADKYKELSKGVDNLGQNVSLTTDEYKEYNSIVNQIADMFPELISGYTEEGNAILSLKGNVEQLRDAYKEAQQEAYNMLIASGKDSDGNDIIKNFNNQIFGAQTFTNVDHIYGRETVGLQGTVDILKDIQKITSATDFKEYINSTRELVNFNSDQLEEAFSETGLNDLIYRDFVENPLTDKDLADIKGNIQAVIQSYEMEINAALKDVQSLANAYLNTNPKYDELDSETKNVASIIVNSLDRNIASEFNKASDVGAYVDNILDLISTDETFKNALTDLLTLDTSSISLNDATKAIDRYLNIISNKLNQDKEDLKISLGFSDLFEMDEKVDNEIANSVKYFKNKFGKELGDIELSELENTISNFFEAQSIDSDDEIALWVKIREKIDDLNLAMEEYIKQKNQMDDSSVEISFGDAFTKLDEMTSALDALDEAYSKFADSDVDTNITFDDLSSLNEEFANVEGIENYIKAIQDAKGNAEATQEAFNDLATAYVNQSGILDLVDEGTKNLIQSMLEERGIANANELIQIKLAESKAEAAWASQDLSNATVEEINALANEVGATGEAADAFELYLVQKMLAEAAIDVNGDISNLAKVVESLGIATKSWQTYYKAKREIDILNSAEQTTLSNGNTFYKVERNGTTKWYGQSYYDKQLKKQEEALKEYQSELEQQQEALLDVQYSGGAATQKAQGSSDKEPTIFDSAAESVNNLKNQLEDLNDVLDKTDPYSQKLPILQALINKQQEYNNALQNQAAVYKTEYDNALAALPEEWQQRITGYETFSIDVVPENLQDAVENAQTYRDKWNEVNDAIRQGNSDLKDQNSILQELAQTKLDNEIGLIENNVSDIQNQIDLIESLDLHATEDQYRELISSMDSEIGLLNSKLQGYYAQLYELEASGATDSDEYYETADAIQECEDSIYECIQNQYEWNQAMLEIPLDYLEEVNDELNEELESLQEIQSNYDSAISGVVSYIEEQIEKQEELREAEEEAYQAQIDAVQDEIDLANDQIDATNDLIDSLNEQIEAIEKQKELKQEQIDAVQDEIDALQKANEERKEQLNLEEKQYNLERARNQKTNRIYREGQGFVYEADQDAIRDAQDELDDALFDKQISDLEDIIDGYEDEMGAYDDQIEGIEDQIEGYDDIIEGLNEKIDELNEKIEGIEETRDEILQTYDDEIERLQGIADSWNDIASSLQRYKDMLMADQVLGSGWQDRVTSGDTSDLDNMTGKYEENDRQQTWVEKQIEDNEKLIDSVERYIDAWQQGEIEIDEALESINDIVGDIYPEINSNNERVESILAYQDQWTSARFSVEEDIAATNEATANNDPELTATEQRRAAAQAYANQWATSVLSVQGSLSQITTAQQNATNSEDTMLQQRITNLGNFRDSYKSIGAEIASSCDSIIESCNDAIRALKRLEKAENGSSSDDDNLKYLPFGYAKGTKSAKPGLHPVAEKDKPEIIINNDGTSLLAKKETYYPFKGGETVIDANDTQDILEMKGLKPLSQSDLMFSEDKMNLFYNMKQDMVPKFASSGTYLKDVFNSKMPVFTTNNRTDKQGDVNVQISNITLPNVKDADSFVQELSSGRIKAAVNQRLHKK